MNYMSKIAEMLGVELGERFKVTRQDTVLSSKFYMTDNGFYEQIPNRSPMLNSPVLKDLLIGERKIIKLPWRLKYGEDFYIVTPKGIVFKDSFCDNDPYKLALYKLGKIYRTREEAEAHAEEDKAYWKSIRKEFEE